MPRRRIIDPDESDGEEETAARPSNQRNSRATRASRRRPQPETAEEDEEPSSSRELGHFLDEDEEENPFVEPGDNIYPSIGEAVLAAFALFSKGPIKEADIKPLLNRGRFKDWQDGLNDVNVALKDAFGFTLVYDGPSHLFFVRNDLSHIRGDLTELYADGTLAGIRIDDGSASINPPQEDDEFNEDDKKGLVCTLLTSIMMSNNIEMGHKNWLVDEDILLKMCKKMKVPDDVVKKTLSGYNAEFIRKGWIRKVEEKDVNQDVSARYTWGPRAVNTVSTLEIFKKYCLVNKQSELEWGNYHVILQKLDEKNGLSQ